MPEAGAAEELPDEWPNDTLRPDDLVKPLGTTGYRLQWPMHFVGLAVYRRKRFASSGNLAKQTEFTHRGKEYHVRANNKKIVLNTPTRKVAYNCPAELAKRFTVPIAGAPDDDKNAMTHLFVKHLQSVLPGLLKTHRPSDDLDLPPAAFASLLLDAFDPPRPKAIIRDWDAALVTTTTLIRKARGVKANETFQLSCTVHDFATYKFTVKHVLLAWEVREARQPGHGRAAWGAMRHAALSLMMQSKTFTPTHEVARGPETEEERVLAQRYGYFLLKNLIDGVTTTMLTARTVQVLLLRTFITDGDQARPEILELSRDASEREVREKYFLTETICTFDDLADDDFFTHCATFTEGLRKAHPIPPALFAVYHVLWKEDCWLTYHHVRAGFLHVLPEVVPLLRLIDAVTFRERMMCDMSIDGQDVADKLVRGHCAEHLCASAEELLGALKRHVASKDRLWLSNFVFACTATEYSHFMSPITFKMQVNAQELQFHKCTRELVVQEGTVWDVLCSALEQETLHARVCARSFDVR